MTAGVPWWTRSPERAGAGLPDRAWEGLSELARAESPERVRAVAEFERGSENCASASAAFSGERRCSSDMTWTS